MEFGERKRRRKSQSFKLVTDGGGGDFDPSYLINSSCKDANGESKDAAVPDVWLGDEGVEIKRQITGMMRLLSDKTSRVFQRVETEKDSSTKMPPDRDVTWIQPSPFLVASKDQQINSWGSAGDAGPSPSSVSASAAISPGCSQHSSRSNGVRIISDTKDSIKSNEAKGTETVAEVGHKERPQGLFRPAHRSLTKKLNSSMSQNDGVPPAVPEAPCCMCNCKGTLKAILQELRAMRRLMQTQKASLERQEQAASPCQPRLGPGPAPRRRPRKRRPIYKVAPLTVSTRRAALSPAQATQVISAPEESGKREDCDKGPPPAQIQPTSSEFAVKPPQSGAVVANNTHNSLLNQLREPQTIESEVRLAEDYDVFISKAQLDSILVNYTRSGSLLFRKLVCAFFDDATLANSLPNGKRKRGLNDNRKGLDQNIVGAIKVFTEKYCTEHKIEKLPGPRDWVQILQDQIKLARRRLKRDAADAEEVFNGPSTSCNFNQPKGVEGTVVKLHG